jgi:protocatechuate 3,4-dioxygenase beta subunit
VNGDDDRPVGQVLTRREMMLALGAVGALALVRCQGSGAMAGSAFAGCVARPAQTEGPYFLDDMLNRPDVRSDPTDGSVKAGAPLDLAFRVSRIAAGACVPLAGAVVDIWQCDADGVYSGVVDPQFDTTGRKYLRGYQITDEDGVARFTTIYPGWYPGRAVHIHFKIRSAPDASPGYEFTSQVYFDDDLTDRVYANAPYAARGPRTVRNGQDGIFRRGGSELLLDVAPEGDGYRSVFDVALQLG